MKATTITIGEVRLSFCHLFQPKQPLDPKAEPKYSTTILLPKSNTAAKAAIDAAIQAATAEGVSSKWGGVQPPVLAVPVYDGDGVRPSDGQPFGAECKGHWVFTASCKTDRPPFVVDHNVQPILQPHEVYSGVHGNINVTFFAYNAAGKKGIGCGLNGFQKTRDDDPLGGGVTAQEAFKAAAPAMATPVTTAAPVQPQAVPSYYAGLQIDPITGAPLGVI